MQNWSKKFVGFFDELCCRQHFGKEGADFAFSILLIGFAAQHGSESVTESLKVTVELFAEIDDTIHFVGCAMMLLNQQQLGDLVQLANFQGAGFAESMDAFGIRLFQIGRGGLLGGKPFQGLRPVSVKRTEDVNEC